MEVLTGCTHTYCIDTEICSCMIYRVMVWRQGVWDQANLSESGKHTYSYVIVQEESVNHKFMIHSKHVVYESVAYNTGMCTCTS